MAGRDANVPTKLETPDKKAIILRASILPRASACLLIGVTRRVAIVPLSFSPAMDSGVTDIHPDHIKMMRIIGSRLPKSFPVMSSLLARS